MLHSALGQRGGKEQFDDVTSWKESSVFPWWQMKLGTLSFACLCGPPYVNCDVYELPVDPTQSLTRQREIGVAASPATACPPSASSTQLPVASARASASSPAATCHGSDPPPAATTESLHERDGPQQGNLDRPPAMSQSDGVQFRPDGAFVEMLPQALVFAKRAPEPTVAKAPLAGKMLGSSAAKSPLLVAMDQSDTPAAGQDAAANQKATVDTANRNCWAPDMMPVGQRESFIAASSVELEAMRNSTAPPLATSMEDIFG